MARDGEGDSGKEVFGSGSLFGPLRLADWSEFDGAWRWSWIAPFADTRNSPPAGRSDAVNDYPARFADVGFPHIEQNDRPDEQRYKPYRQLISYRAAEDAPGQGEPIPYVHCMGYGPETVAERAQQYHDLILSLSMKYGVSASLVKAVITEESCFNPGAISPVGAAGLMQLMPDTASWLNVEDPHDVEANLNAGIAYLSELRDRFGSDALALAAYNAGPGNVERYAGVPPFAETVTYVERVLGYYRSYVAATRFASRLLTRRVDSLDTP